MPFIKYMVIVSIQFTNDKVTFFISMFTFSSLITRVLKPSRMLSMDVLSAKYRDAMRNKTQFLPLKISQGNRCADRQTPF